MQRKHRLINSDFIIVLAIAFAFTITSMAGGFSPTPKGPDGKGSEQIILTPTGNQSADALQLNTFRVNQCASTAAIDFLIDNSGSMQFGSKMIELKKALMTFSTTYPEQGLIAMQSYSENVKNRVPFGTYKSVKDTFIKEVNAMAPETATHSRDAFAVAEGSIMEAKRKFPHKKFSLVFISDGIPESADENNACPGGIGSPVCTTHPLDATACRCYDVNQDPTPIANRLKSNGIQIFTIAFLDDTDKYLDAKLQNLMRSVASSLDHYFQAPIETQLTDIIKLIATKVCSEY